MVVCDMIKIQLCFGSEATFNFLHRDLTSSSKRSFATFSSCIALANLLSKGSFFKSSNENSILQIGHCCCCDSMILYLRSLSHRIEITVLLLTRFPFTMVLLFSFRLQFYLGCNFQMYVIHTYIQSSQTMYLSSTISVTVHSLYNIVSTYPI